MQQNATPTPTEVEAKRTLNYIVSIHVDEVLYAVMNRTAQISRTYQAGADDNSYELAALVQADDSASVEYELKRSLEGGLTKVIDAIGEYLEEADLKSDNLLAEAIDKQGIITLELILPGNARLSQYNELGPAIHHYLTDTITAEWLAGRGRKESEEYAEGAKEWLLRCAKIAHSRRRPVRVGS